jgi:hypothetical protein
MWVFSLTVVWSGAKSGDQQASIEDKIGIASQVSSKKENPHHSTSLPPHRGLITTFISGHTSRTLNLYFKYSAVS